jgi:hypothetical protein
MINFIILFFIIITIILLLNNYEYFTIDTINFINTKNACSILKSIENEYNYTKLDLKLRNIDGKYKNNLYKYYCDNLTEFTKLDKTLLLWVFNSIKHKINELKLKIDLLFIFRKIQIAKFEDFIDNGYPHTNSNIIFLTSKFINQILPYYNSNNIDDMIINIGSILIHESIHIWQRRQPEKFELLYKKYWHFTKPERIFNIKHLEKLNRFNPDGKDIKWVFNLNKKHILFMSLYNDNAKTIGNVKYVGVYLDKQKNNYILNEEQLNIGSLQELNNIDEFNYFFTHLYGNHYHPNEISAELLSIYYLKIMKLSHRKYTNIAYTNMIEWLKLTL